LFATRDTECAGTYVPYEKANDTLSCPSAVFSGAATCTQGKSITFTHLCPMITCSSGYISNLATLSPLRPRGIAVDTVGYTYVTVNHGVRKISPGGITAVVRPSRLSITHDGALQEL
jgi:hypothetical protein